MATTNAVCDSAMTDAYAWTFDVTNLSGIPVHHLYILPEFGADATPNHFQFDPALGPGATASGLTVQVSNAAPSDTVTFRVSLHDSLLEVCCSAVFDVASPCSVVVDGIPRTFPGTPNSIQNFPNPFNPITTIEYHVGQAGRVRLVVHDVAGHVVRLLYQGVRPAGPHRVRWDGRDYAGHEVASGVYLCVLSTPLGNVTRKLVLVR